MPKFTVKETPYIVYQKTTAQGIASIDGEDITWRWSEDDNGDDFIILGENGWEDANFDNPNHILIYVSIMEFGSPFEFEEGDEIEIEEDTLKSAKEELRHEIDSYRRLNLGY